MVSARTCLELGSGQGSSAPLHAVAIPGSGLTGSPCWSSQGHPARLSAMELSASSASPFCSLHPPGQPVNPHPQPKLMMSLEGQGQEERHGRQSCSLGPRESSSLLPPPVAQRLLSQVPAAGLLPRVQRAQQATDCGPELRGTSLSALGSSHGWLRQGTEMLMINPSLFLVHVKSSQADNDLPPLTLPFTEKIEIRVVL